MSSNTAVSNYHYASKLLDQLRELDLTVHGAYYDMGRILAAIDSSALWADLGYGSLKALVEEELSFSNSQARRYLNTFRHFKRLHYSKAEALDLIGTYSFTYMSKYLPTARDKVGKRAVGNAIRKLLKEARQINFQLAEADLKILIEALKAFGAEVTEEGRVMNSSSALVEMAKLALESDIGD